MSLFLEPHSPENKGGPKICEAYMHMFESFRKCTPSLSRNQFDQNYKDFFKKLGLLFISSGHAFHPILLVVSSAFVLFEDNSFFYSSASFLSAVKQFCQRNFSEDVSEDVSQEMTRRGQKRREGTRTDQMGIEGTG